MNIVEACHDQNLFRPLFRDLSTWTNWMVVLKSIFALPMTEAEQLVFTKLSGRVDPPKQPVEETWIIAGRRGGKSRMAALIAVYLSCFKDYSPYLSAGERIKIIVLAVDRAQAGVIFRYAVGFLDQVPMLRAMVERETADSVSFSNRVDLEVTTNNFRSVRGTTIGAAILDEAAFWRSEFSASPDIEVVNAIRPAMATIPNALLIGIGSPYRRAGVMYDAWKRHYANDESSTLVIQASSQDLNPTIADSVIAKATEADAQAARSEWYAEFRSDLSAFLDMDLIERAVEGGRRERAPVNGISYVAFTDPSGGSHDSFTLAIGHEDKGRFVVDMCRGIKPPFSPESIVKEFATLLKNYRCSSVVGDRYSGEWVREAFSKEGIYYQHSDLSKSECYLESLPLFSQGVVDLVDYQPLLAELQQLERRTSRSGRDSVDHPPNGRDDLANSVCGCLALLASRQAQGQAYMINFLDGSRILDDDERLRRKEAMLRGVPVEAIR